MLEIEVKAQCDDPRSIEIKLKDINAKFEKVIKQKDIYFSHPSKDFADTDEALRLRHENDSWTLHYKGPKIDGETKTREELGLDITDPDTLINILNKLGFNESAVVEKIRTVYRLDNVEIAIDNVVGIGNFVELEIQDEDLESAKECIFSLLNKLGLRKTIRSSYLELLENNLRLKQSGSQ